MGKHGKEVAALFFGFLGAASGGWRAALFFAVVGVLIGWQSSRKDLRERTESRTALQKVRSDELRLVTNFLHASGIPAWREAALELAALEHRETDGPRGLDPS